MKTRILHTKFWDDPYISSLSVKEKLLFNYLLTNSQIGLSDIYECSEQMISFHTGLTIPEVSAFKEKFMADHKFLFFDSYIKIVNGEKYNQYRGDKNEQAKNREIELIPDRVLEYFDTLPIGYCEVEDTSINHKSKTINQKPEIINQKSSEKIFEKTPRQIAESFFAEEGDREEIIKSISRKYNAPIESIRSEINKFVFYWTEPNGSGKKLRWQMQKTFDVKRRLFTWLGNVRSLQSSGKNNISKFS